MSSAENKGDEVEGLVTPKLTEDLENFLLECEKDFSKRYTDEEKEFSAHMSQSPSIPPLAYPWGRSQQHSRHPRGNYSRNYDNRNRYDDRSHHDHRDRDHYGSRNNYRDNDNWRRNNNGGHRGHYNHYKPY